MAKHFVLGTLCLLLLLGLAACDSQELDAQATIDALNATLSAHEQQVATLEIETSQPSPSPLPSPTVPPTYSPTLLISTPRPVTTHQRPPTATPPPTSTSTPLPPTSTSTPTPLPDAAVGKLLTNLRAGPAVGFDILAEVEAGTPLMVLGKSADSEWLKVRTPEGLEGWMYYLPLDLFVSLDSVPLAE